MKLIPQNWQSFKYIVGLTVIFSAIAYGILVTAMILIFGEKCSSNSLVWNTVNTIVSTTLGWYLAKASTVIDYIWGSSHKATPAIEESSQEPGAQKSSVINPNMDYDTK